MKAANDALRFCLELSALAAIAMFAWHSTGGLTRWAAVVAAPLAAAGLWGWFMAPRSAHRLDDPERLLLECAFFVVAALALAATGRPGVATALALAAAMNIPLDRALAS